MADFCKACSEAIFGEDFKDLANLCEPGKTCEALCENCGMIAFNHHGCKVPHRPAPYRPGPAKGEEQPHAT